MIFLDISTKASAVAWPSGLRRWFKAPVSSEAWVRIPPLPESSFCFDFISDSCCIFILSWMVNDIPGYWHQRISGGEAERSKALV
ncbi:hypothetical protein AVEN_87292-1 [Araneus ventricosus]|uniref:Uncharacterized protein n=1 Tax=Araneus ventricosus TaxID=182803 RepID=A0A4Y2EAN9_ARAVE|nr:hypothetical protein AVEN_87292-1 [Araneus ventricosus]